MNEDSPVLDPAQPVDGPAAPAGALGALAATGVASMSTTDVGVHKAKSRSGRLQRLAGFLALVLTLLVLRDFLAPGMSLPRPSVPPALTPFMIPLCLIVLLVAVMVVPLLAAGRSPHILYRPDELTMTFDDVRGSEGLVEEVTKTLNLFLAYRTFNEQMGGTPRKAILFEGPPGTGKTYMAKAMASEAGVPFLFVSSSAFQSMFYGQTNRKIRAYFKELRRQARREGGAIGFIEELDAIGGKRGTGSSHGDGIPGVVNELLIQLQSFEQTPWSKRMRGKVIEAVNAWLPEGRRLAKPSHVPANILVIGATNRAEDLDAALVRPGRFDRNIYFGLPGRSGRRDIFDYYLGKKAHAPELDDPSRRETLAAMTAGYSPVMIEHLLDEALVWALRRGAHQLSWEDVQHAKMTEEIGLAQPVEYTEAERRTIATHEAGHATVAWLVGRSRKLEVLTIIKRRDALGLLSHSETEERFTNTRTEVKAMIDIAFGGMVAEELFFGESSTGVAGDLQAATVNACQMIGLLGMGSSLISVGAIEAMGGGIVGKVLADDSRRAEVEALLADSKESVTRMLDEHRHVVEALRDALLVRSELIGEDILDVIRRAQGDPDILPVDMRDGRYLPTDASVARSTPPDPPIAG
ncbi:MAG: AAA family ATPase [Acidimicrobiales bacterium]|jgi:ATP-dependent Zn protease